MAVRGREASTLDSDVAAEENGLPTRPSRRVLFIRFIVRMCVCWVFVRMQSFIVAQIDGFVTLHIMKKSCSKDNINIPNVKNIEIPVTKSRTCWIHQTVFLFLAPPRCSLGSLLLSATTSYSQHWMTVSPSLAALSVQLFLYKRFVS